MMLTSFLVELVTACLSFYLLLNINTLSSEQISMIITIVDHYLVWKDFIYPSSPSKIPTNICCINEAQITNIIQSLVYLDRSYSYQFKDLI